MSSRCAALLRINMDILCPSLDDIYKVNAILKSSQSIVHHNIVLQTKFSPAIVTLNREDSLNLLERLQQEDWEKVLAKKEPVLLLK
jgi:hypothetical protein